MNQKLKHWISILCLMVSMSLAPSATGDVLKPQSTEKSPSKVFSTKVIPLNPDSFDFTKALVLICENPKWMTALAQNSRTFEIEWSPSENFLAVFNCGLSKENELSIYRLSREVNEVRVVAISPTSKKRTTWEILEWDEGGSRVQIRGIGEDGTSRLIWIDLK